MRQPPFYIKCSHASKKLRYKQNETENSLVLLVEPASDGIRTHVTAFGGLRDIHFTTDAQRKEL